MNINEVLAILEILVKDKDGTVKIPSSSGDEFTGLVHDILAHNSISAKELYMALQILTDAPYQEGDDIDEWVRENIDNYPRLDRWEIWGWVGERNATIMMFNHALQNAIMEFDKKSKYDKIQSYNLTKIGNWALFTHLHFVCEVLIEAIKKLTQ